MRELNPWQRRSIGRDRHRKYYQTYIVSPAWYERRKAWAIEEAERVGHDEFVCRGGCGRPWNVRDDDLHHVVYDRLGDEAHEDLWPLCRECHTMLHDLLLSSRSWRKLPRMFANMQAIAVIQSRAAPRRDRLSDYL